jgi:hypothetical protein
MEIFVFGSNLAGRHGKGAALEAKKNWGAIYGRGEGLQGRSYGIPTKDMQLKTLPLDMIQDSVNNFLIHAYLTPSNTFRMTRIGCGLAGYKDCQIAPMFRGAPPNVNLPPEWLPYVERRKAA